MNFPKNLHDKILKRSDAGALRQLGKPSSLIDFSSNDYLGLARSVKRYESVAVLLQEDHTTASGATGSRLISGNHQLYLQAEQLIAGMHHAESALIFNSGYDANVGFFSAVPQRSDVVLYDELCHASIRDGLRLGVARSFKFLHNDLEDLDQLIQKYQTAENIYIVTESVFSMDGDSPDLSQLIHMAQQYGCYAVIDEAHALGVFGENGEGLVQQLGLQDKVFARIMTFGKGLGCHGAAVVGSSDLSNYLVNFARSFIYTTGLPPHSIASIITGYNFLQTNHSARQKLVDNILHFNQCKNNVGLKQVFVRSKSAIQSAIIPGNERVKNIASNLNQNGFNVKAILSPTVPEGQERLRFCLHSYNTADQITAVMEALRDNLF